MCKVTVKSMTYRSHFILSRPVCHHCRRLLVLSRRRHRKVTLAMCITSWLAYVWNHRGHLPNLDLSVGGHSSNSGLLIPPHFSTYCLNISWSICRLSLSSPFALTSWKGITHKLKPSPSSLNITLTVLSDCTIKVYSTLELQLNTHPLREFWNFKRGTRGME